MRVLLVSTNRLNGGMPPIPLGLACVAACVDRQRHELQVWDAMFADDWRPALRACVTDFGPDVIGFSIRNVDDQKLRRPTFFLGEAREMVALCRQHSSATLVGGGAGFSLFPAPILDYLGLDCGVVGEGELAFPSLLEALSGGETPAAIPGLVRRADGRVLITPPDWSVVPDRMPAPRRDTLDLGHYYAATGNPAMPNPVTLQSKRGCPMPCTYCSTRALEGRFIRCRRPEHVVDEMEGLRGQGFQRLHFVDNVFTNPAWHARAICEEILRRGLDVRWSAIANPGCTTPSLLRLMKQAGCVLVLLGNEHADSGMLHTLGKRFDPKQLAACFRTCEAVGLPYHAFLLLGGPGESRDSVQRSVEFLQGFAPAWVNVTVGIRLYPGCALTRQAMQEGLLDPADDLLVPRFYLAPGMRDWIWEHMDAVVERNQGWGY
ncbi:MAG: radical SAM protein [Candidatus Latescibacterota bacterium]